MNDQISLQKLSEHFGRSIDDLKQRSYQELANLTYQMGQEQMRAKIEKNGKDPEYVRLVKKFLSCWEFLTSFWTEEEVAAACSRQMDIRDIVQELPIEHKAVCHYPKAEFIKTDMDILPRYTKNGEQLLYGKYTRCDIYRIPNPYQGTHHGKVVLDLLYRTYPQLREFGFSAYEVYSPETYELYPSNHVYTPLKALLNRDVDQIIARNMDYAKSYQAGIYTTEQTAQRLQSPDVLHYFDVIRSLPDRSGGMVR